jgi:hypothetical protein
VDDVDGVLWLSVRRRKRKRSGVELQQQCGGRLSDCQDMLESKARKGL